MKNSIMYSTNQQLSHGDFTAGAIKRQISCGIILYCMVTNRILIGKVTNNKDNYWDIPKGRPVQNESYREAAVRECLEETGIILWKDELVDFGLQKYTKKKDLWLFGYPYTKEYPLDLLHCDSTFLLSTNAIVPEICDYKYISFSEISKYLYPKLAIVIANILIQSRISKVSSET